MQFQLLPVVSAIGSLVLFSAAQFPPPVTYDTVLKSPVDPNVTISYKSPDPGTCTTAFSKQKQYTGYINLPPSTLAPYAQNYSINTFFWFIEARENPDTAPLTIWLNGGPGSSSMIGLFRENGPCEVVQLNDSSYGTQARMWGWDRGSNMLYFDQPTQTGFSYDTPVNQSYDLVNSKVVPFGGCPNSTLCYNGTFPSGNPKNTQNTTAIAASAAWHFLQTFLSAFPQYNPGNHPNSTTIRPAGINLFTESYGGQYGPAFADHFEDQNAKLAKGDLSRNSTLEIKLVSLGIINGLVDVLVQTPFYPKFAYNNTYKLQLIDQTTELNALNLFNSAGGCQDLANQCRDSMKRLDPDGEGDDSTTNSLCSRAAQSCAVLYNYGFNSSSKNYYDIRIENPDPFPSYAYLEYLNSGPVQQSIGAKVNYTESSTVVLNSYLSTGDEIRGTALTSLADLLTKGIRVALMYGDADFICNWYGGEAISLALARLLPSYSAAFPAAGYGAIVTNSSYIAGDVRQYGNLSFSRIFDAGHLVPAYQSEAAFTVFSRIIQGDDISIGTVVDLSTFGSTGPPNSNHANKVPAQPEPTCWIRDIPDTCSEDEQNAIVAGDGVVIGGVWYSKRSDYTAPASSVNAGVPGSLPTSTIQSVVQGTTTMTIPLTGVYTATGTPKPTSGASSLLPLAPLFRVQSLRRRDSIDCKANPFANCCSGHRVANPSEYNRQCGNDEDRAKRKFRAGLGIAAAVGGALLVLPVLGVVGFSLWRLWYARKEDRHYFGGPKDPEKGVKRTAKVPHEEMPPELPPTHTLMAEPEAGARPVVERVMRPDPVPLSRRPGAMPSPKPIPEEPEEAPFHGPGTRLARAPIEPTQIPGKPDVLIHDPPTPVEVLEPTSAPDEPQPLPEPLSTHPTEHLVEEECHPLSRSLTEPSPVSRRPTEPAPIERREMAAAPAPEPSATSEAPLTSPQRPLSERDYSELPSPLTRAQSFKTEPPSEEEHRPSIVQRIRNTWRHSLGSADAAPGVIEQLKDKATTGHQITEDEAKAAEAEAVTNLL